MGELALKYSSTAAVRRSMRRGSPCALERAGNLAPLPYAASKRSKISACPRWHGGGSGSVAVPAGSFGDRALLSRRSPARRLRTRSPRGTRRSVESPGCRFLSWRVGELLVTSAGFAAASLRALTPSGFGASTPVSSVAHTGCGISRTINMGWYERSPSDGGEERSIHPQSA